VGTSELSEEVTIFVKTLVQSYSRLENHTQIAESCTLAMYSIDGLTD
jgi:hypothetical protein